jgi:hypothetical protein
MRGPHSSLWILLEEEYFSGGVIIESEPWIFLDRVTYEREYKLENSLFIIAILTLSSAF